MTIILNVDDPEDIDRYASDFFMIIEFLKHKKKMIEAQRDADQWSPDTRLSKDVWEKAMKDNAMYHRDSAEHIWNNIFPDWIKDILRSNV